MAGIVISSKSNEGTYYGEGSKTLKLIKLFFNYLNDEFEDEIIVESDKLADIKIRIELWIDVSLLLRNNVFETFPYRYQYKDMQLDLMIKSSAIDSQLSSVLDLYNFVLECLTKHENIEIYKSER